MPAVSFKSLPGCSRAARDRATDPASRRAEGRRLAVESSKARPGATRPRGSEWRQLTMPGGGWGVDMGRARELEEDAQNLT